MFRSFLGRLCTYGVVLGVNALPFAVVAATGVTLPEPPRVIAVADEPEGEDDRVARWTPIPVSPADAVATDAPEVAPEAPPAPDPVLAAARPAGGRAGGKGRGGAPALAQRAEGPAAGDGSGAATEKGDGDAPVAQKGRRGGKNSGRRKSCEQPHPNIHPRDGEAVVDIDRALVDEYTKNLESFMQLGYSRPYDEDGLEGWYISGFSCTSPVAKAGFQRGDVLLRVNGKKTRSWVGVFLLYQRLKNKEDFEVDLVRKGAPLTLKFHVVDA